MDWFLARVAALRPDSDTADVLHTDGVVEVAVAVERLRLLAEASE